LPEAFIDYQVQLSVGAQRSEKLRKAIQAIAPDLGTFANQ